MSTRKICLVGMPAVGKTAVAPLVAKELGIDCALDLDALIAEIAGKPASELLRTQGETAFRDAEAEALRRALEDPRRLVIALGAGAVLREENRDAMQNETVFWLRASEATIAGRLSGTPGRVLTSGAQLARRIAERTPLYAEVADIVIDTDDLQIEGVAEAIVSVINTRNTEQGLS